MNWHPAHVLPSVTIAALVLGCSHRAPASNEGRPAPEILPTASHDSMTSDELARQNANSLDQFLVGRFPGVIVRRVGNGVSVQVRGGGEQPLYIVDGVQVRVGTDGALSWLRPEDIESIRVLKDPSELALYGSRGGSGVVIIRTKGSRGP